MIAWLLLSLACSPPEAPSRADDTAANDSAEPVDSGSDSASDSADDTSDSASDTSEDSATDTSDDSDSDTAVDGGLAVERVFDGLSRVVDAVVASDGTLYASGEGGEGAGVYRWDGTLRRVRAIGSPAALASGTDGNVYAIDGTRIVRVSDGAEVDGPDGYSPETLDLMSTSQGDRLTFSGRDPRSGARGAYTVKAAGGAVALVGDGYTSAARWLFRPGGETVWTVHADGHLWQVPDGSDTAADRGGGFPTDGLTGSVDGAVLYLGDDAALVRYEPSSGARTTHPLDLPDGALVSVHAEPDGVTLLLGVQSDDGAAVYRCVAP